MEPNLVSLSVYMSRPGIVDPDRLLKERAKYLHQEVTTRGSFLGSLYVIPSQVRRPSWLRFFEPELDTAALPLQSASASAVLLVQRGEHAFALAFGHGRHMLAPGAFDERFGLRVTLNAIDPTSIRSIDRKTFEAVSRHTREQLSKAGQIEQFGLDVEQDLLRAVTGRPTNEALGKWLSGMDSLAVTARIRLGDLRDHLDRYRELSNDAAYKLRFPWVDNVAEVRDTTYADKLDRRLLRMLSEEEFEHTWLAPPRLIEWADYAGFRFGAAKNAVTYDDLTWENYLSDRKRDIKQLTIDTLRNDRIFLLNAKDDSIVDSWSVYNCVCAEVELANGTHVLSDGKWFKVSSSFASSVDETVRSIPRCSIPCPDYNHDHERHYNADAAQKNQNLHFMDGVLVARGGGRSQIEVCDLLSSSRCLLHVKRYKSSASLSHLFAQGLVSGQVLAADLAFRQDVAKLLPPTHELAPDAFRPWDYEIAFCVIGMPNKDLTLPFFSRVNLKNAATQLRSIGYKVALTPIKALCA